MEKQKIRLVLKLFVNSAARPSSLSEYENMYYTYVLLSKKDANYLSVMGHV